MSERVNPDEIVAHCARCGAPILATHGAGWNAETGEAYCAPHIPRPATSAKSAQVEPLRATLARLADLRDIAADGDWLAEYEGAAE